MQSRPRHRLLRRRVLLLCAAAVLAFSGLASVQASAAAPGRAILAADSLEHAILARVNAVRRGKGLRPLRLDRDLARASDSHARSMARKGFFSHSSADGTSPVTRILRFYRGSAVGEAMLWRSPDCTAAQAVEMWLASPPHRAILLSSGFREIGLGAVRATQAPGVYGGRAATIVVADFGAP
jgi:uncharacterized protein YkwD